MSRGEFQLRMGLTRSTAKATFALKTGLCFVRFFFTFLCSFFH